jgi:hypothetical protein
MKALYLLGASALRNVLGERWISEAMNQVSALIPAWCSCHALKRACERGARHRAIPSDHNIAMASRRARTR